MTILQKRLFTMMVLAWAIVMPTLMILDYRDRPVYQEAPAETVSRVKFNMRYGLNVTPVAWHNSSVRHNRRIPLNRYKR